MSLDSHRKQAESAILSAMTAAYPSVKIKFQNANFRQPETPWIAFFMLDGKSLQANLGASSVDRHVGLVQIDVQVPNNSGTKNGNAIAEFCGNVFRKTRVVLDDGAVVRYRTPEFTSLGEQVGFYRIMCRVAYWRDEPST